MEFFKVSRFAGGSRKKWILTKLASVDRWPTGQAGKIRKTGNKEVVIMDDYDGDSHQHGVLDSLICPEDDAGLRVMGDYKTLRYIKGHSYWRYPWNMSNYKD